MAIFLVPAFLLISGEWILRLAGYGYSTAYWKAGEFGDSDYLVPNSTFTYRFFPPALARAPLSQRIRKEKPPRTYRIFLYGESAAYGDPDPAYGVGRYLEVLLEKRFPETDFEVVCTAMTAINSHAILPIARESAGLDGDLWIIYMGNNEMVGAYGAGTVFSSRAPPLVLVRLMLALKQTRTGQLVEQVIGGLGRRDSADGEWEGINMFSKTLRLDDPGRLMVYRNFRRNLEDILSIAEEADIPVILGTVATNLKDCAPFSSPRSAGMKAAEIKEWERLYEEAIALEEGGRDAEALAKYHLAEKMDPGHAEMLFRIGQCQLRLGNAAEAREAFERARDHDGLAVRADSRINGIIREAGARARGGRILFVDVAEKLAKASPENIPGRAFFYEHVHFTLEGNYRLARLLAEEVVRHLPEDVRTRGTGTWVDASTCGNALAVTLWDQYRLWNNMSKRLSVPPHTAQLNHEAMVGYCEDQGNAVIARIDESTPRADRLLYIQAIAGDPGDNLLYERFGQYLEAMGARPEAIRAFEKACELVPDLEWPYFYLGEIYRRAGRYRDAQAAFEHCLEIRRDFRQAQAALGEIREKHR